MLTMIFLDRNARRCCSFNRALVVFASGEQLALKQMGFSEFILLFLKVFKNKNNI